MQVEDEFLDVLQNIEFTILSEFRHDSSILDMDARDAIDALARRYEAEAESRGAPNRPLAVRAGRIFQAVLPICEWRLGRSPKTGPLPAETNAPIKVTDLVRCLKRIRLSIDRWNKELGVRGYLSFVNKYVV